MREQLRSFFLFFCCVMMTGTVVKAPASLSKYVAAASPERHANAFFKKAHASMQGVPLKQNDSAAVAFGRYVGSLIFSALSALLAGMLLMFTPYGALALVFALGALYVTRKRSFDVLIKNGLIFVGAFVPVFALTHMFLPYLDEFLEHSGVYLVFSLVFITCVACAAFALLGIVQARFALGKQDGEAANGSDGLLMSGAGAFSALMLLTQKTSAIGMAARQVALGETLGMGGFLSLFAGLGVASIILGAWVAASNVIRDEYVDLWVLDSMGFIAWFALYKSVLVLRPLMFSWQYNLILTILTFCAGLYYWMSVRTEITYQYIDAYSKAQRVDTLLHIFGGWRFFSPRILLKRCAALIAFAIMISCAVKTYLFFFGITMREVILAALKSL